MGITWIAEKGNTLWKVGVFEEGKVVSRVAFEYFNYDAIPSGAIKKRIPNITLECEIA